MRKIFINGNSQIRAGWKLLMVISLSVLLLIGMGMILNQIHLKDPYGITIFIAFILAIAIMLKYVDKKAFQYIGVKSINKNYKYFFAGLFAGAIFIILNIIILIVIGQASFSGSFLTPNITTSVVTGILLFIIVGIAEEMLFRGYIIMTMQQMGKWWLSALVSALIFALSHGALNDNISSIAVFNLFLGGLLLAYIFIKMKNIWMCVGFHITWNYFQGYIFGISVSGRTVGTAMYTVNINENNLAGGAFGLEGGIINTVVLVGAFIYVWFYSKKSNRIKGVRLEN